MSVVENYKEDTGAEKKVFIIEEDGTVNPLALSQFLALNQIKGRLTTVGGNASESFTIIGAEVGDLVFIQLVNQGTNVVTVLVADVTATDEITLTFNDDPDSDTVFNYLIIKNQ